MEPSTFEAALKNHNWPLALVFLNCGQDISAYLEPGNTTMHLAIIWGYKKYVSAINDTTRALDLENLVFTIYPDSAYLEENMADTIVQFIEELLLRDLDLTQKIKLNYFLNSKLRIVEESAHDILAASSQRLSNHLSRFMQTPAMQDRTQMLTLYDATRRHKQLALPKDIYGHIAGFACENYASAKLSFN